MSSHWQSFYAVYDSNHKNFKTPAVFFEKKLNIKMDLTTTIYDLVVFYPHAIDILDHHNLDYFCNGAKPFLEACNEKHIDPKVVLEEIQRTESTARQLYPTLERWTPEVLTSLILRHYSDLGQRIPSTKQVLDEALQTISKDERQTFHRIVTCFEHLSEVVAHHASSEEKELLRILESQPQNNRSSIRLTTMEDEHRYIGTLVDTLRSLTSNYDTSGTTSPAVSLAYILLHQFDKELTLRLHLENNILFPKLRNTSL